MAWFAAQLKAAEGLLEAVDKTVSKTVGTLSLAEGEAELSGEYSYPRPAGNSSQQIPPAGTEPYAQAGGNLPTSSHATSQFYSFSGGTDSTAKSRQPASASRSPPWDSRAAASPAGYGSAAPSGPDGGGFTVKADAPIPFGSRPVQPPASALPAAAVYTVGSISRNSSQTALGGVGGSFATPGSLATAGATPSRVAPSTPAAPAAGSGPFEFGYVTSVLPPAPLLSTGGATSTTTPAGGQPSLEPKWAVAPGPTAATAPSPLGTTRPLHSLALEQLKPVHPAVPDPFSDPVSLGPIGRASGTTVGDAQGDRAPPRTEAPSSAPAASGRAEGATSGRQHQQAGPAATAAASSAAAGGPGAAASPASSLSGGDSAAGVTQGAEAVLAATAAAAHRKGSTGIADGTAAGSTSGSGTPILSEPVSAVPAEASSSSAVEAPQPSAASSTAARASSAAASSAAASSAAASSAAASSAAVATASAAAASLTSATTAAASTLASATTTAVSHSLSFFNLMLDDPDAAAAGAGGGGGGAAAPAAAAGGGDAAGGAVAAAGASAAQVAALSRTCEQLRKRLEASRVENEQLEDMLARAEVRAQQEAALVASLKADLAAAGASRAAAEGSLAAQLAAARGSLGEMSDKYEAAARQVLLLEGQLAALEESSRRLMEAHSDREGGMLEALRGELSACEARLAAERKAAAAGRAAAAAREADLEAQIAGSSAALADLTRGLEEANRRSRALEEEMLVATRDKNETAAQLAALRARLAEAGLDGDAEQGPDGVLRSPAGGAAHRGAAAAAAAELELLRGEVMQQRRAAAAAQAASDASAAQAAALAAEVESLRRGMEQHKDTVALEAQLREASDMLYLKQTQLERLAAEKAAQQIKTERELEAARQELAKLSRQLLQQGGGAAPGGGTPHDVIPMDALGEPYQRLTRHTRVGRAVKAAASLLDSTAATTSFVLRQYPLARLAVFAYVLLIHTYVYMLLARMQRLATQHEAATAPRVG